MKRALIFLADGFEEVEALTPADYMRRAGIEVILAGIAGKTVKGARGVTVLADAGPEALADTYDAVICPGGMPGARNLAESEKVRTCILRHHAEGRIVAAICASPAYVLEGSCHLLKGKKFTGYPGTEGMVQGGHYLHDPVVIDGTIITSRGPGTAGAFAIALIDALAGHAKAQEVRQHTLLG
ncbi:MAG: DJ-1/PfpI family protein [Spirochaetaceae bacterium]|nr:DJ-1/PfpI family protein [Spirochaetaceae bacterium]